jgi:NADH:ubiquinone oxidoreductase subunit 3 (subunit A)
MSIFGVILYWGSFLLSYFFSKSGKNYLFRDYYECGFKELPDVKMQLDISFSILGLIFLVYEFEIILFVPVFLNFWGFQYFYILVLIMSFFLLSISYWYEWDYYCLF